jgi:hypothetical protein
MIGMGSLRNKLIGVMLLTTLLAVVVALGAMIAYDLRAYHRGWIDNVSTQAEMLGRSSAPALAFDDARVARDNLAVMRFQPKVRAAALYTARGALFASYLAEGEPEGESWLTASPRARRPAPPSRHCRASTAWRSSAAAWSRSAASSTTARSSARCTCAPTTSSTTTCSTTAASRWRRP